MFLIALLLLPARELYADDVQGLFSVLYPQQQNNITSAIASGAEEWGREMCTNLHVTIICIWQLQPLKINGWDSHRKLSSFTPLSLAPSLEKMIFSHTQTFQIWMRMDCNFQCHCWYQLGILIFFSFFVVDVRSYELNATRFFVDFCATLLPLYGIFHELFSNTKSDGIWASESSIGHAL